MAEEWKALAAAVPAFVEMSDGSFRSAKEGRLSQDTGGPLLILDGVRYRVMRRPSMTLDTGEPNLVDAWVTDAN